MKLSLTVGPISPPLSLLYRFSMMYNRNLAPHLTMEKVCTATVHKESTLYYSFAITLGPFLTSTKKSIAGSEEAQICIKG